MAWFGAGGPGGASGNWKESANGYDWRYPELYVDIAHICERGKFDFMMFADGLAMPRGYQGTWDHYAREGSWVPMHDPVPIMGALSYATRNIGIVGTLSTTFYPPFSLARVLATLDHLSRGRIGWNVVTSMAKLAAQNYGYDDLPAHDDRYAIADEYMEVVHALWSSWESDALLMDRTTGVFADPRKIHSVDFEGKYFRSAGPLTVPASPQGHPVIVQAGASPRGQRFAAQHAELSIAGGSPETMKAYSEKLRTELSNAGRDPYSIKILMATNPLIGETDRIAQERAEALDSYATVEMGLATMSEYLGIDMSQWDIDQVVPADLEVQGYQSKLDGYKASGQTLGEIALREAKHDAFPVRGTPEHVADILQETAEAADIDGYYLRPGLQSVSRLVEFVDKVVPVLQTRGAVRTEYTGSTLRAHLTEF
jgi:FMN-dependent oxidoreductase (nitrilotriacetate monooxygenase family)